jgi:SAM-dependent methyltransferase
MKNYEPSMSFGADEAEASRDMVRGDEAAAVDFLHQLAANGRALELGIGTGRIALPLVHKGVRVEGVDISPAMIAVLQSKPGGNELSVTKGSFADLPVAGTYSLVYVVWNTFFNLLTQAEQVLCFKNVSQRLGVGGCFLVEAYVPAFLHRLPDQQHVRAEAVLAQEVRLDVLRHDSATQTIEESHVSLSTAGVRLNPVVQRYAWPAELDLMAQIAGLHLRERWGGWNRETFNSESPLHVSVYEK